MSLRGGSHMNADAYWSVRPDAMTGGGHDREARSYISGRRRSDPCAGGEVSFQAATAEEETCVSS